MDEFTEIVPNALGTFIDNHLGFLAIVKSVFFKKNFVLLQRLFLDGLLCTLMILAPKPYFLKPILFVNPISKNSS